MHLHAAASRRRLGELLGAAPGQALVTEADQWMREQTIRDPARMTSVYAPGFTPGGDYSGDSQTSSNDST
jgi:hypothetical protein